MHDNLIILAGVASSRMKKPPQAVNLSDTEIVVANERSKRLIEVGPGEMIYPYLKDYPVNPVRNEKELPTALLNMLADHPGTAIGIPFSEHVPDLTAKDDNAAVKEYLQKHYPDLNW